MGISGSGGGSAGFGLSGASVGVSGDCGSFGLGDLVALVGGFFLLILTSKIY